MINFELDPALLIEIFEQVKAIALKAALWQRLNRRPKALISIFLILFAQELAHDKLFTIEQVTTYIFVGFNLLSLILILLLIKHIVVSLIL